MAKKNKKRGNRMAGALTWAVTFVPAMLAAMTAFWNTREQGFTGDGKASKKSKRSGKRATA